MEKEDLVEIMHQEMKKKNEIIINWIANLVRTPFTRWIAKRNLMSQFFAFEFDLFDRTTDPME